MVVYRAVHVLCEDCGEDTLVIRHPLGRALCLACLEAHLTEIKRVMESLERQLRIGSPGG